MAWGHVEAIGKAKKFQKGVRVWTGPGLQDKSENRAPVQARTLFSKAEGTNRRQFSGIWEAISRDRALWKPKLGLPMVPWACKGIAGALQERSKGAPGGLQGRPGALQGRPGAPPGINVGGGVGPNVLLIFL